CQEPATEPRGIGREMTCAVRTPLPRLRRWFPQAALTVSLASVVACGGSSATLRKDSPYAQIVPPGEEGDDKVPPATATETHRVRGVQGPTPQAEPEPDPPEDEPAVPEILPNDGEEPNNGG